VILMVRCRMIVQTSPSREFSSDDAIKPIESTKNEVNSTKFRSLIAYSAFNPNVCLLFLRSVHLNHVKIIDERYSTKRTETKRNWFTTFLDKLFKKWIAHFEVLLLSML
jgi:hypothetical protein